MTITLAQADAIVAGALAHGAAEGLKPLSVVVLDAGGHVKAFDRQDGAATAASTSPTARPTAPSRSA